MKQQVQYTTNENSKNEPSTGFYSKLISNFDQELTVREDNLESVQGILSSLKFEVFEIWTHEDGKHHEIWGNENIKLKLNVVKNEEAKLSDVVKEIDYLFWELRASEICSQKELTKKYSLQEKNPQRKFFLNLLIILKK